jgi:hypothetical protein
MDEEQQLFDADFAQTALGRKQRAQTSVIELMLEDMNPGFKIAKQLYGNYINELI